MIKLTEETRKILRAVFRGVGAVTASLSLSACPFPNVWNSNVDM